MVAASVLTEPHTTKKVETGWNFAKHCADESCTVQDIGTNYHNYSCR